MASTLTYRHVAHVFKRQLRALRKCSLPFTAKLYSTSISGSPPTSKSVCLFSGIQPTSNCPHLGNYLGAIKQWVSLQEKYSSVIFSLVDLHSITLPYSPEQLRNNLLDMTACLLACGINPDKCILFQQSQIPQHSELAWILGCHCSLLRLKHLPQWKEKSKIFKDASVGLFSYPILQAADILLYRSNLVPVGEDQVIQIELARDIAHHFNQKYGKLFEKPDILKGDVAKVLSLREPTVKMSKSAINPLSRIDLIDSAEDIQLKIKKAQTDCTSALTYEPESRPGVTNLINIHCAISGLQPEQICKEHANLDTGRYKIFLADVLIEFLSPIQAEIKRLQADKGYLVNVLEAGRQKAAPIAEATMKEVKDLIGFAIT